MKYKFEKSKYPIFKYAFWILLFCSAFLFLIIAKNNAYFININNYSPILKPITLNAEFTRNVKDDIFVCFDDFCKALKENSPIAQKAGFSYISSTSFTQNDDTFYSTKINNVYLALPKNMENPENKIKNIDLYIENDLHQYSFSDIEKLKNKTASIHIENKKDPQEYTIYSFENSNNYTGLKNHLMLLALSFAYKIKLYTFPYCWLFVSILIFLFNKDAFKYSLKTKAVALGSSICFIVSILLFFSILLPKTNDAFSNYILKDIKNYSKTHKTNIITPNYRKITNKLKDYDINWHYTDSKDEKLNKIEKDKYVNNNEKAIIYFDSNSVNMDMISFINAKAKIYKTNYGSIGKLIYD